MYYKITNGAVSINEKTILESINLEIKDKDKIAIIGRNGAGKTTLLKALIDNDMLSEGTSSEKFNIFQSKVGNIGYLKQNSLDNTNNTLEEEILLVYKDLITLETKIKKLEEQLAEGADSKTIDEYSLQIEKYKLYGGYEYKKEYLTAIAKFGFSEADKQKSIKDFSGGERTKIAFLKLLLSKPDLLLLDEPTNHLDISTIEWLEEYLKNYPKCLVIISHDRLFINRIVNKIYEIEYGETQVYMGNYEYFENEKQKRYQKTLKDYEFQQKEIKRLQSIADRFRYKPSKAKMAMSKLKQIERMVKIDKPKSSDNKTFNLLNMPFKESGRIVLKVDNLGIGYASILSKVSFELSKKERLGIIGANGKGKSTLLKTIMNIIPPLCGNFELGHNVTIGYFDQQLSTLNEANTVYDEFQSTFKEFNDFQIRSALASFMFYESDINKSIKVLSGGEKVRLELSKIIYQNPNFLILDEPTNHLDILSKEKLEKLLKEYQGTILFVSHDRYFVKNIATSLLVFENTTPNYYNLTYDEYMSIKHEENLPSNQKTNSPLKPKLTKEQTKDIKKIEREITKHENTINELNKSLFNPEVYNDYQKVEEIRTKISDLENKMLSLMEELEK